MTRRRALGAACFAASLLPPLGCSDDAVPVAWEGEHVVFRSREPVSNLCRGTLPNLDALVGHLGTSLGVDAEIEYNWVPEDVSAYCPIERGGCARNASVFSDHVPHQHEVVHAVRDTHHAAYDAFEEGLAEYFGDDWEPLAEFGGTVDELWRIEGRQVSAPYYPIAGYFVSYLDAEFGRDSLRAFDEASTWRDDWPATAKKFESVFSTSFDDVVDQLVDGYPRCLQTYYRENAFECAAEAIPIDGPRLVEVDVSCGQPDVVGPRRGDQWATRVVEIRESRTYDFRARRLGGSDPGRIEFRRCGQTCADRSVWVPIDMKIQPFTEVDPVQSAMTICIPQGRYVFRFLTGEGDGGTIELELTPVGPIGQCPSL